LVVTMRKLFVAASTVLLAGLMISVVACGPGASSTPVSSSPGQTRPGLAVKLAFTTQPVGGIAGSDFNTQPVIAAEDAEGNVVNGYQGLIVLTITGGTGDSAARLLGGTKIGLLKGMGSVEFKSLSIDKAGVGYTLTASSGNLTPAVSEPLTILPGEPAKLGFTRQPSGGKAGVPLTPNPEVTVQDIYGNIVTGFEGSVTLKATVAYWDNTDPDQSQPTLQTFPVALLGTTTVNAVNGVARFSDISNKVATFAAPGCTLIAVSGSLKSAASSAFTVSPGAPAKLEFTQQPFGGEAGLRFETQPYVAIEDIYGNVVTSSRAPVTVSIAPGSGTAGAILSGTKTIIAEAAYGGLASFYDLSIDLAGSGYMLTAATDGVPTANSQPFDVSLPSSP
jgi:trimeric autotransporter adhesin